MLFNKVDCKQFNYFCNIKKNIANQIKGAGQILIYWIIIKSLRLCIFAVKNINE